MQNNADPTKAPERKAKTPRAAATYRGARRNFWRAGIGRRHHAQFIKDTGKAPPWPTQHGVRGFGAKKPDGPNGTFLPLNTHGTFKRAGAWGRHLITLPAKGNYERVFHPTKGVRSYRKPPELAVRCASWL